MNFMTVEQNGFWIKVDLFIKVSGVIYVNEK